VTEELQNAFHALSQQLYAQQQTSGTDSSPRQHGNGRDEGEVLEGEFTES